MTDNEVNSAILAISQDKGHPAHQYSTRLTERQQHFKRVYSRNPGDSKINPRSLSLIYDAAVAEFGSEHVRKDEYLKGSAAPDFPVLLRDGQVVSCLCDSDILAHLPSTAFGNIFVNPNVADDAMAWLARQKNTILS